MNYQQHQAVLSRLIQAEEQQRQVNAKTHQFACVPWRGAGGEIGRCIYCGKIDSITQFYTDRANGHHAAKAT